MNRREFLRLGGAMMVGTMLQPTFHANWFAQPSPPTMPTFPTKVVAAKKIGSLQEWAESMGIEEYESLWGGRRFGMTGDTFGNGEKHFICIHVDDGAEKLFVSKEEIALAIDTMIGISAEERPWEVVNVCA